MNLDFDFLTMFVEGLTSVEVLVAVIGFLSAIAFTALSISKFGNMVLPQPRESRVSDFLPFASLMEDGMTIRCANGSFVRVFRITGMDLGSVTPEKVYSMMEARKAWIDNMSELQVTSRIFTLRELSALENDKGNFNNDILARVSEIWFSGMERIFSNTHYVVLSVPDRKDALKDLNYACQSLVSTLSEYGVSQLYEAPDSKAVDSPLYVFSRLCSPVSKPQPKVRNAKNSELKEMLTADHIHFTREKGVIRFFSGEKELYEITMGIRTTGDYMDESMIISLLSMQMTIKQCIINRAIINLLTCLHI